MPNFKDIIGSVFGSSYNLENEIVKINSQLETIEAIIVMANSEGWSLFREILIKTINNTDGRIIQYAENPNKHKDDLIHANALRTVLYSLIRSMDKFSKDYEIKMTELRQKITQLNEATANSDLVKMR